MNCAVGLDVWADLLKPRVEPNRSHKQHPPAQPRNGPDEPPRPDLQPAIITLHLDETASSAVTATVTVTVTVLLFLLSTLPSSNLRRDRTPRLKRQKRRRQHQHKHMSTDIMPTSPRASGSLTRRGREDRT